LDALKFDLYAIALCKFVSQFVLEPLDLCFLPRRRLDELGDVLPAGRREELTETARAKNSIVEYVFVQGGKP
jgi:hypothetical protein